MFTKLFTELKKRKIPQRVIAEKIGCTSRAVNNKLLGKSDFTSSEMYVICELIPDVPMHELFIRG